MSTIKVTNLQNASAASPAIVLDANSRATLNGLSYPTEGSLSGRNRIINGDMRIDQRNAGASVNTSEAYIVDRFRQTFGGGGVITGQRSTTVPAGFTNSLQATVTTADSSIAASDYYLIQHRVEGFNIADFGLGAAGAATFTLSFWVRSSVTGTYGVGFANASDNRSYPSTYSVGAANTWEYKTITLTGDTSGTWLKDNGNGMTILFDLGSGSNFNGTSNTWASANTFRTSGCVNWIANSGATFYLTGVSLEAGSVATPFERRSYGQELALCQRYYYRIGGNSEVGTSAYTMMASGMLWNTGSGDFHVPFKVGMRSAPSITYGGNVGIQYQSSVANLTSQTTVDGTTKNTAFLRMNTAQTWGAGPGCNLCANNDTTAFVAFSSEL